jgi:DNA-directed RNA polymerase subunit RPC12/RpoP
MKFRIQTNLPENIHGVQYVKNSHFLELIDEKERSWRGGATGIVKYHCESCHQAFYSPTNHGELRCPMPGCGAMVIPVWHKAQLSFIPEEPSQYRDGYLTGFKEGEDENDNKPKGG